VFNAHLKGNRKNVNCRSLSYRMWWKWLRL